MSENLNQKPKVATWVRVISAFSSKKRLLFLKILFLLQRKKLYIDSDFTIGANCNLRSAGEIHFERYVSLASNVNIETNLRLGRGTIVSSQVAFIGNDHSVIPGQSTKQPPNEKSSVNVGSNCWIGYGTIIIGPVNVCSDVIIGAGSIVTRSLEEPGVYIGAPARKIR